MSRRTVAEKIRIIRDNPDFPLFKSIYLQLDDEVYESVDIEEADRRRAVRLLRDIRQLHRDGLFDLPQAIRQRIGNVIDALKDEETG